MNSDKVDKRIREMAKLIRPHLKNSSARELYERARAVAPALVA
jgi:hypothetical protein